jgi:hypothetical protein
MFASAKSLATTPVSSVSAAPTTGCSQTSGPGTAGHWQHARARHGQGKGGGDDGATPDSAAPNGVPLVLVGAPTPLHAAT